MKLLRDYAFQNDLTVVQEFIDIETAKTSGRQNFNEMVQFLTKRDCRIVLVEKTDRLYRNFRDAVTLEDLDVEIHLVKEGQIISKDARSQAKLIHGIQLVLSRNYIENLREEVKKGMREKAEQGIYPGRAPLGYRNNKADRTIEVHPENAAIVRRIFELYACGQYSLSQLKKLVREESGKSISRAYLHTILTNPFIKETSLGADNCTVVPTRRLSAWIFPIRCRRYCAGTISRNIVSRNLRFVDCCTVRRIIAPSRQNARKGNMSITAARAIGESVLRPVLRK
jgi:DNA invertase Pin-like site-specific DNA recombinase